MEKLTSADAGCWIDGHYGIYATERVLSIAKDLDWPVSGDIDINDVDQLFDATDEAVDWMNKNVAPEGFSFGWHDGEFFLWSDEEWEED